MTLTSQNGWPVIDDSAHTRGWVIPGANRTMRFEPGDGGFILAHYVTWHDRNVADLSAGKIFDDWSHAVRNVRNSTAISNHSSATAADLDAVKHGLGRVGTFANWQVIKIRGRLLWMNGVVRWGGDYHGRKDEMHFELNVRPDNPKVKRLAKRLAKTPIGREVLRANPGYKPPRVYKPGERDLFEGCEGPDVRWVQHELRMTKIDGQYGPKTAARVKVFEQGEKREHPNLKVDGVVGKLTWIVFGIKPKY